MKHVRETGRFDFNYTLISEKYLSFKLRNSLNKWPAFALLVCNVACNLISIL